MKTIEKEIWNIYGSLVVYAYQVSLIMYISMLWLVGFGSFDVFSTAIENSSSFSLVALTFFDLMTII